MSKILALLIRKLAEGDFGPAPAKVYWALAGKKTYIGITIASISYALSKAGDAGVCDGCAGWVKGLSIAAAFLVSIGLLDGAVRSEPPYPPPDDRFLRR